MTDADLRRVLGAARSQQKHKWKEKQKEQEKGKGKGGKENRSGDEEDSECTSVLLNDDLNPADLSVGFYEGDVEEFSN